ncbi:guanylate kinase [Lichenihabitans sp. Uapishka_5]|nr:guanylate kinase [Lichenihabitans sp. Uapishka_5]MDX7950931.1 guanylate kinase [Lichenihabitans sp. Uapishka_5]
MTIVDPVSSLPPSRRGLMLILSSPSGAGKTTLTRLLLQNRELDLTLSVSVTTRARRASEADGIHYHFITPATFAALRDAGDLLEHAEVHGNSYGTPRAPAEEVLAGGRDMLFDIDYQGTQQVRAKAPQDAVTIFILPPSMRELRGRLERRAEDSADVIDARLAASRNEISRWTSYDYVLVNEDLQQTFGSVLSILKAERLRRLRQTAVTTALVARLMDER